MKRIIMNNKSVIIIISIILAIVISLIIIIKINHSLSNKMPNLTNNKQIKYKHATTTVVTTTTTRKTTTTKQLYVSANIKYHCGSTNMWLEGNRCYWTNELDAYAKYECPYNYYYDYVIEKCKSYGYDPSTGNFDYNYVAATITYSCLLEGYTLEGTKCKKTESSPAGYNATCPAGYIFEKSSMKCKRVGY